METVTTVSWGSLVGDERPRKLFEHRFFFHLLDPASFWVQSVGDVLPQSLSLSIYSSHGASAVGRGQLPRYDRCSHGARVVNVVFHTFR